MRKKWNAILAAALIAIFLLHGAMGSFMLLGLGNGAMKPLAWAGVALAAVHAALGALATARAVRGGGRLYLRQNALFWARRVSGLCLLVLACLHFGLFGGEAGGQYILFEFTTARMAAQMLLIAALFAHIAMNARPLLVSLGILAHRERRGDIFLILSLFLLLFTVAVVAYYVGWQA
ncbi:MAG: pilus assembly protein PilX [Clostridiales bacterium]|jgi:hypothetical protein|nr:pilus assembly protein PilX [Clostridiales bacterium]